MKIVLEEGGHAQVVENQHTEMSLRVKSLFFYNRNPTAKRKIKGNKAKRLFCIDLNASNSNIQPLLDRFWQIAAESMDNTEDEIKAAQQAFKGVRTDLLVHIRSAIRQLTHTEGFKIKLSSFNAALTWPYFLFRHLKANLRFVFRIRLRPPDKL